MESVGDRVGLAVGGGLIAVLALLVGIVGSGDGSSQSLSSPVSTPPSVRSYGVTPTSSPVVRGERAGEADLAVVEGDEVVLIALDGTELGRGPRGDWYPSNPDRGVDLVPVEGGGWTITEAPERPATSGCGAMHVNEKLEVEVCGSEAEPGEIRVVAADNTTRLLTGPINPIGHWRYALPSPDGRWVLAQWSAECEVPVAYLFPTTGGPGRPVAEPYAETIAVGWTPDGQVIVGFMAGACGEGNEPGTYLVDPNTLGRHRIHPSYEATPITPGA